MTRNFNRVLSGRPRPTTTSHYDAEQISGTPHSRAHQTGAGATEVASEKGSGGRRNAATRSGRNGFRIRMWTVARTHFAHHLLTVRTHGGVSPRCMHLRDLTPSATHPSRRSFGTARRIRISSESHLGSTLRPGGAVLTRGVSRRSGSVAYIHADASPTEVLASPSWHQKRCRSNIIGKRFAVGTAPLQIRPHTAGVRRASPTIGATPRLGAAA